VVPVVADDTEVVVAEGIDLVLLSRDEVLIQFGSRSRPSELLRDDELTGLLGSIVEALSAAPASVADLVGAVEPKHRLEARRVIVDLLERGILTDLGRDPVEQYLRYTFEGDRGLDALEVTVLGAGPLGARIASTLALHPVGAIRLLDSRLADEAWRVSLPFRSDTGSRNGHRRVDSLVGDSLRERGASVEVLDGELDLDGIRRAVTASDLTFVALDRPDFRLTHLVNRVCLQARRPWLFSTIDGNRGLVGPLFLPPYTACFNDYSTLVGATMPSSTMADAYRRRTRLRTDSRFFPGLPVYADIVAGHASLAGIHFLLRDTSFALGRQLVIDFDGMRIDVEDVLKLPRCPVCGSARPSRRPVFPPDVVNVRPDVPAGMPPPVHAG
jgi:bacteriocin biosynthesis cyclodehydratase domain-containing protein